MHQVSLFKLFFKVLTHKRRRIMYPANTIKDLGIKDGDQLELESSRDTIPDVWEHITLQSASSVQKISVQKIMSLPFQDIQVSNTHHIEWQNYIKEVTYSV